MAYGMLNSDIFGITKPVGWSASGFGSVADSLASSGSSAASAVAAAALASSAAAQATEYSDPFKLPRGYRPVVAQPCRYTIGWLGCSIMVFATYTRVFNELTLGACLEWHT